jgi:predicted amidohydrolase YtcJ
MSRLYLLLFLPALAAAQQQQPADLIVTNARIYTVDEGHPIADAMAVRGGKVQFVGSTGAAMALRGASTRVIDLAGRTVIPGMVDAHGHVDNLGLALRTVDLTEPRRTTRSSRASPHARRPLRRASGLSGAAGIRTTGATLDSRHRTSSRPPFRTIPCT